MQLRFEEKLALEQAGNTRTLVVSNPRAMGRQVLRQIESAHSQGDPLQIEFRKSSKKP